MLEGAYVPPAPPRAPSSISSASPPPLPPPSSQPPSFTAIPAPPPHQHPPPPPPPPHSPYAPPPPPPPVQNGPTWAASYQAPPPQPHQAQPLQHSAAGTSVEPPKARKKPAGSACNSCHRLKTRCSGGKPCDRCVSHNVPCEFDRSLVYRSPLASSSPQAQAASRKAAAAAAAAASAITSPQPTVKPDGSVGDEATLPPPAKKKKSRPSVSHSHSSTSPHTSSSSSSHLPVLPPLAPSTHSPYHPPLHHAPPTLPPLIQHQHHYPPPASAASPAAAFHAKHANLSTGGFSALQQHWHQHYATPSHPSHERQAQGFAAPLPAPRPATRSPPAAPPSTTTDDGAAKPDATTLEGRVASLERTVAELKDKLLASSASPRTTTSAVSAPSSSSRKRPRAETVSSSVEGSGEPRPLTAGTEVDMADGDADGEEEDGEGGAGRVASPGAEMAANSLAKLAGVVGPVPVPVEATTQTQTHAEKGAIGESRFVKGDVVGAPGLDEASVAECYSLFFEHCHPFLPTALAPASRTKPASPLLHAAVLAVAARFIPRLSPHAAGLADAAACGVGRALVLGVERGEEGTRDAVAACVALAMWDVKAPTSGDGGKGTGGGEGEEGILLRCAEALIDTVASVGARGEWRRGVEELKTFFAWHKTSSSALAAVRSSDLPRTEAADAARSLLLARDALSSPSSSDPASTLQAVRTALDAVRRFAGPPDAMSSRRLCTYAPDAHVAQLVALIDDVVARVSGISSREKLVGIHDAIEMGNVVLDALQERADKEGERHGATVGRLQGKLEELRRLKALGSAA